MTTAIVPVNAYGVSLSIPADGEGVSSASVALYVQEIANRLEFIRQRVPGANPVANLMNVARPMGEAVIAAGSTVWQINFTASTCSVVNNLAVSVGEVFLLNLDKLVPGAIIRNFSAIARGAAAHAALPAVMPKIELVKCDFTAYLGGAAAPAFTVIDTQADTSASTAAYQLSHLISKTLAAPETVGVNTSYALRMTGESGANSLLGMQWSAGGVQVSA